ncbi:hypothetical protein DITRI_Ditri20bG0045300 [Diplodiscus trichospermus]
MWKAIKVGNNRRIDRWNIVVKKAIFGWNKRRFSKETWANRLEGQVGVRQIQTSRGRVNRSYKEVLTGPMPKIAEESEISRTRIKEHFEAYLSLEKKKGEIVEDMEVNFDISIPLSDMKWLESCVFGKLKENLELKMINRKLKEAGLSVQACRLGGLSVVLKFESMEGRDS